MDDNSTSTKDVFKLPGEPAIVINGVPDIINQSGSSNDVNSATFERKTSSSSDAQLVRRNTNNNIGEWLEGREIRKEFRGEYYTGSVTHFDSQTGWYRVMYDDDANFEDFEWADLEHLLLPLDITLPLKTLAINIIQKRRDTLSPTLAQSKTNETEENGGGGGASSTET